jgi:hypothetical protein
MSVRFKLQLVVMADDRELHARNRGSEVHRSRACLGMIHTHRWMERCQLRS